MGPLDGRALALDGDGCRAHALLIMPMMETSLHVHESFFWYLMDDDVN